MCICLPSVLGKAGLHFITVCCPSCFYLPSHLKENLTTEKLGYENGLMLCLTKITGGISDRWTSLWESDLLSSKRGFCRSVWILPLIYRLYFYFLFMVVKWHSIKMHAKKNFFFISKGNKRKESDQRSLTSYIKI